MFLGFFSCIIFRIFRTTFTLFIVALKIFIDIACFWASREMPIFLVALHNNFMKNLTRSNLIWLEQ